MIDSKDVLLGLMKTIVFWHPTKKSVLRIYEIFCVFATNTALYTSSALEVIPIL